MRIFNLAEELEKERKKNEELKSMLKATNKVLNDMDDIAGEYENRIDKTIEYIEKYKTDDYCDGMSAKQLLDILKGDNK